MGWTKISVETSEGEEQIEVFLPVSRKEAVEFAFKDMLGADVNDMPDLITVLSYLLTVSNADWLANPSGVTFEVLSPSSANGILPMTQKAYEIIKYRDRPVYLYSGKGTDIREVLYGFSPGAYYLFLKNGVRYINASQGPFTPTATGNPVPTNALDFYKIIDFWTLSVTDYNLGMAVQEPTLTVPETYYPLQIIDHMAMIAVRNMLLDQSDYFNIVQVIKRGAWKTVIEKKALFDVRRFLHNPAPYLALFIKNGLQGEFSEDYALALGDKIAEAWADFQAKLLDMNLYPGFVFLGSPWLAYHSRDTEAQQLLDSLTLKFFDALKADPETAIKSFVTLSIAVTAPAVLDRLQYIYSYTSRLAKASDRANKVLTPINNMIENLQNFYQTFYSQYGLNRDEVINDVKSDPYNALISGKYALDVKVPSMAVPVAIASNTFYIPGYAFAIRKGVISFTGYADKSWLAKHKGIATITGLEKLVEGEMKNLTNLVQQTTEALAKLMQMTGRFTIDTTTEYTIQVENQTVTLKGPKGVVIDMGNYYKLVSLVPVDVPCPFTSVFYYRWTGSYYQIEPRNPFKPYAPYVPPTGCSNSLLTADQLFSMLGYGIAGVEPQIAPLEIAIILIFGMAMGAIISAHFLGAGNELVQAYSGQVKIYAEALENVNEGINAEKEAIETQHDLGSQISDLIELYLKENPDDPANKQIIDDYMKIMQEILGNIKDAQDAINNGMSSSAKISQNATEAWDKFIEEYGKILSIFSPSNVLKWVAIGGAILIGISVIPPILTTVITNTIRSTQEAMRR